MTTLVICQSQSIKNIGCLVKMLSVSSLNAHCQICFIKLQGSDLPSSGVNSCLSYFLHQLLFVCMKQVRLGVTHLSALSVDDSGNSI